MLWCERIAHYISLLALQKVALHVEVMFINKKMQSLNKHKLFVYFVTMFGLLMFAFFVSKHYSTTVVQHVLCSFGSIVSVGGDWRLLLLAEFLSWVTDSFLQLVYLSLIFCESSVLCMIISWNSKAIPLLKMK